LYQNTDVNFTILHSLDGYDEISLTSPTKIITSNGIVDSNASFDIRLCVKSEIEVKTVDESAQMFTNIISKGTEAQNNVVSMQEWHCNRYQMFPLKGFK
jgi:anthranilate phosphoribosyltransferase